MLANSNTELPITCPKCNHEFKKTLGWLEKNSNFSCPTNCGFTFEGEQLIRGLEESLQALKSSLGNTISRANKKLKF